MKLRCIALLAVALASCGDDASEGSASDGGVPGPNGSVIEELPCERDKSVKITFIAPSAVTNPAGGPLQNALVDVSFTARGENSTFIDPARVQLFLLDANGVALQAAPVMPRSGQFHGAFDLSTAPNGQYGFRATATTTTGKCGRAEVKVGLDLGPVIRAVSPMPRAIVSASMEVSYDVEPSPMGPSDESAAMIDRHFVVVAGREIPTQPGEGGRQRALIAFNDPALFQTALQGPYDLEIVARNRRTPSAGERRVKVPFVVDSKGPRITIKEPKDGAVVGGSASVQVEILDDGAGLDLAKLGLSAGQVVTPLRAIEGKKNMYEGRIDLSGLGTTVQETTIAVFADDLASNHTVQTVSVKLDGRPPLVSLDPPLVRVSKVNTTNTALLCSTLFDPVGSDSVNDGMIIGTAAEFRARIEDRTNSAVGNDGALSFLAGIDDDKVQLFLSNRLDQKLLIDQDGDGICDQINPALEPSTVNAAEGAAVVQLKPAPPTPKGAFYSPADDVTATPASAGYLNAEGGSVFAQCVPGIDKIVPKPVCVTSPLTEILHADGLPDSVPAIYGKAPIAPQQPDNCAGDAYDYQNQLKTPGWACVAVRAYDKAGNVGVSAPLRVCFDNGSGACGGNFGDMVPEAQRPSCTASCAPAPSFEAYSRYQLVEHTR